MRFHGLLTSSVCFTVALGVFVVALAGGLPACSSAPALRPGAGIPAMLDRVRPRGSNGADFEGGNIGRLVRTGTGAWEAWLRSDNDDALPLFWRQWFYFGLQDVPTDVVSTITVKGAGHWNYYVPVWSYDGETWQHFREAEVKKTGRLVLQIKKKFARDKVWLARYMPYTYSKLNHYIDTIRGHRDLTIDSLGDSPMGHPIPHLTITDRSAPADAKTRIVIHARTHPGEVGSSFLLEGLINRLLAHGDSAARMRRRFVYEIVPMLNVDGVVVGNNRVTPCGTNLEGKWYRSEKNPLHLDPERTPLEVQLFARRIVERTRDGIPVTMAFNLHASAGEPDDNVFFFPHFGPPEAGYSAAESALFSSQMRFIQEFIAIQGKRWFNPVPRDGGRFFASRNMPESWWWHNFGPRVMALSIESTYGRAGNERRWMQPADMRRIGSSMAEAIDRWHRAREPLRAAMTH